MADDVFRTKAGRVLDEDAINALADEAEKGYDLSRIKAQYWRGRPSLSLEHASSPRIAARLPPALYEAVTELAHRKGQSVSSATREALEKWVKEGAG